MFGWILNILSFIQGIRWTFIRQLFAINEVNQFRWHLRIIVIWCWMSRWLAGGRSADCSAQICCYHKMKCTKAQLRWPWMRVRKIMLIFFWACKNAIHHQNRIKIACKARIEVIIEAFFAIHVLKWRERETDKENYVCVCRAE